MQADFSYLPVIKVFPYNSAMQEVIVALVVLAIGLTVGGMLKPTEAQLAPLSPDEIRGNVSAEPDAHHHH
jgi:hypothetical protein